MQAFCAVCLNTFGFKILRTKKYHTSQHISQTAPTTDQVCAPWPVDLAEQLLKACMPLCVTMLGGMWMSALPGTVYRPSLGGICDRRRQTSFAACLMLCADRSNALQELNVKLTKLGRQVEANQVALQEIKAALQ